MHMLIGFLFAVLTPAMVLTMPPSPDELRGLIRGGATESARAAVAANVSAFDAGELSADDLREVFIALSRSDPAVVAFVKDWNSDEPANPQAQIARAWSLYSAYENVKTGRNMYSYEIANEMYYEASKLATQAYLSDPSLIPASDAMVRGLSMPDTAPSKLEALEKVMSAQPNWGTVARAMPLIYKKDGFVAAAFCKRFTQDLGADAQTFELKCRMQAALFFGVVGLQEFAANHAWDDTPEIELERLAAIVRLLDPASITRAQMVEVERMFNTFQADQFEFQNLQRLQTSWINNVMMLRFPLDYRPYAFKQAHLDRIQGFLENDPYNIALLRFVGCNAFGPKKMEARKKDDGGYRYVVVDHGYTEETRAEFYAARKAHDFDIARRRLGASPYSDQHWSSFANLLMNEAPETLFDGDLAMQNALAFADTPLHRLNDMLFMKFLQLDTLREVNNLGEDAPEDWVRVAKSVDVPRQIYCPFLRAYRLREFMCMAEEEENMLCSVESSGGEESFAIIRDLAMASPECTETRVATEDELWYSPVPFSEAVGAASRADRPEF